ncbi:hypothetical protein MW887_004305 [Aspergillus wentii]|nr:hypothetical protein MW887_004305 [Aspergillus wentii]
MLGLGFLAGGIKYSEQTFSTEATKEVGTLLLLAAMAIAIPTVSHAWSDNQHTVPQSRATAFVLVVTYVIFLYFQIYSHKPLFETSPEHEDAPDIENKTQIVVHVRKWRTQINKPAFLGKIPFPLTTLIALIVATALIGFHSTFAIDNLSSLMEDTHISSTFIGVVILPLLSNDIGPIKAALHNKMDQCIASTVGKRIQTSLLAISLIIFIAWGMGVDTMSLDIDGFEVITLFISALYVNFVIANEKCN